MVHKGKKGFRAVSFQISEDIRAELLRITGQETLTAAVHEALADFVLRDQEEGPLRKRRELERKWIAEAGFGLRREWEP
jgi:hypothetical protein